MEMIQVKWEYIRKFCPTIEEMNNLGQDRWELVDVMRQPPLETVAWYLFKRPILENKQE